MARRKRNPGFGEWAKAHPWMTFFLVGSALAIPIELYRASLAAKALEAKRQQPQQPPQFTPGVFDPAITGNAFEF